ncbi:MAG: DUF86 domain-containing protein, partial [Dehalococcoidales bacterium]|nr:DUF86 domain-containing protein [Dehalococcoidales bacterium]
KILEHANDIVNETAALTSLEDFQANNDKSKAALFDLMQIGELVGNSLSQNTAAELKNIPWTQIYALRNRIVHGYASVDYQIIWETIRNDIPKLIKEITVFLSM